MSFLLTVYEGSQVKLVPEICMVEDETEGGERGGFEPSGCRGWSELLECWNPDL